jgi:hypothetical protein
MDASISLQDVANVITFVVPGYFAIQLYVIRYAKRERDFSKLLVESIMVSLPLVALTNVLWEKVLDRAAVDSLNTEYALLLLAVSVVAGGLFAFLRTRQPLRGLAQRLGLGSPEEDFVKEQFARLNPGDAAVTVVLKNGDTFSGTPARASRHSQNGRRYYYFSNLVWFNAKTSEWSERKGGIIIEQEEIEFIETPPLKDDE